MKKGILFIFILIISYSFYFADNMRNAADFFEWLLAEDYDRLLEHLSVQSVLDTEQLKKLSDELEAHYGFITSYLSCEQKEKLCALAVQMENAQVLVLFVFDEEGKIITLTVEPVENTIVKTSRIAIQTVPKEASVYINQVFKGWTPIVISDYPGVFELRIHKNGFLPLCQTLQLNHLDQADLTFQLIPSVRLHELDYMAAKSILLNSFDRGGWFTADWVTETVQGVVLSDEHVTQGQKSLKVNFQMNEPSEVIVQYPYAIEPRNLKGSTLFFIDVFLDVRETVLFSMALQVGSEWKWTESEPITLKKGMHFDLPVHFKTFDSFDEVKVINLKLYIPTPQSSGTVYYDNLRFF